MGADSWLAETRAMLPRKRTLLAAATTCAAVAIPSVASAKDFCVAGPAGCTGTPVAPGGLKTALDAAQSNGTDDRFFLAPGTYASTNLSHQSTERVQIIGAGTGNTIVRGNANGPVLTLGGNPDSSVAGLTVEPTGAANSGLRLFGTLAHDLAVHANGASSLVTGIELFGETTLDHGSVDVGPHVGHAITATAAPRP
jgi:hypothetical protein